VDLEPNDLLVFARVVDEGSFSRAAERLSVPKSTVSRRVAALEAGTMKTRAWQDVRADVLKMLAKR